MVENLIRSTLFGGTNADVRDMVSQHTQHKYPDVYQRLVPPRTPTPPPDTASPKPWAPPEINADLALKKQHEIAKQQREVCWVP